MAKLNGKISGKCVGDTIPIQRTFQDVSLVSATLSQVLFVVKKREKDADASAVINITITSGASSSGTITDASPSDGSIEFFIKISRAQSSLCKALREYFYGMATIDTSGEKYTLEKGIFVLEKKIVTV